VVAGGGALSPEQERVVALLMGLPTQVALHRVGPDGFRAVTANDVAWALYPGRPDRVGRLLQEYLPEELSHPLQGLFEAAVASGAAETRLITHTDATGSRTSRASALPLVDPDGVVRHVVGVTIDLTREVDEAGRARQRFRTAFYQSRVAMLIADPDNRIIDCNDALAALLGRPVTEIIGSDPWDLIHPDDRGQRPRMVQALADYQERTGDTSGFVWRFRALRPDGTEVPATAYASYARDEDGTPRFLVAHVIDRTQRERAERERDEALAWARVLLESAPEMVLVLDLDSGEMLMASENCAAFFGYELADLLGPDRPALLAVRQPDGRTSREVAASDQARALAGETVVSQVVCVHRDGTPLPVESRVVRLPVPGRMLRISFIDIRDRLRDEAERERLAARVQHQQKLESLGVLAGGIAHDFNNLLVGILGNVGLAASDLPPGSPVHETLRDIEVAAQRAADLTRQMLAYSGRGRFAVERVDLSALVEETTRLLAGAIGRSATLRLDLPAGLPSVEVDVNQVRQIVMNLVTNAADALGGGAGLIAVRTTTTTAGPDGGGAGDGRVGGGRAGDGGGIDEWVTDPPEPGRYVVVEVADTGAGMDDETRSRMFDPFFSTKFTGRGLGLAAVLGIVRGHRGAIAVTSSPGEGTTVRVLLPAVGGSVSAANAEPPAPSRWRGTGRVLVADDDDVVAGVAASILGSRGFEVEVVADGQTCIDRFAADPDAWALVVADLTMPGASGVEVVRAVRARRPDVPVVVTTGYDEQEVMGELGADEPVAFLAKPYRVDDLVAAVRRALELADAGADTSWGPSGPPSGKYWGSAT
jgi:two-component system, cell cycle sensor histidine kinase and response regulator CckA